MRYDSGQFGSFDALDNRKEVFILFERLGAGLPDKLADARRAGFLQGLIPHSLTGMADAPLVVSPCNSVEAYRLFGAITGVLGIPVEYAAIILEKAVIAQEKKGLIQ